MKLCALIIGILSAASCLCVLRILALNQVQILSVAKLPAEPSVERITRGYDL